MLYPVRVGEKWGYIDRTGTIRICPQFTNANRFSEGFAPVKLRGHTGILDISGKLVCELDHYSILPFQNGRARFRPIENGKFGFLDTDGNTVIPPIYEQAQLDFWEGLVFAKRDDVDCIHDLSGRVVHTCPRDSMKSGFSHGLAAKADREGVIGYINTDFTWQIRPQYLYGCVFSENKAYVELGSDERAYIDTIGTVLFQGRFSCGNPFSEGVAAVWTRPGEVFLDAMGQQLFGRTFLSLGSFREGYATVEFQPGRIGYIDRSGKVVIPADFEIAYPFRAGVAQVQMPGEYSPSYIDTTGKFIWRHGVVT